MARTFDRPTLQALERELARRRLRLARLLAPLPASAFRKRSAPRVGLPPPDIERRSAVRPDGPLNR